MVASGFLATKNLIFFGDLNFTVSTCEVWGQKARLYPLDDFFKAIFQDSRLVDIVPLEFAPTWHNRRGGVEGVEKCLDKVLCWKTWFNHLVGIDPG